MPRIITALLLSWLLTPTVSAAGDVPEETIVREIEETVLAGVAGWNRGDLEGFMAPYWQSDTLRFASGGSVSYDWQAVLDRYRERYPDRAAMGRLVFSELDVRLIAADAALVFGRWTLERAEDRPTGLFTLVLQRFPEGWRIVHDHTSSG